MVTQKSKRYTFWKFANSTIFRGSPPPPGGTYRHGTCISSISCCPSFRKALVRKKIAHWGARGDLSKIELQALHPSVRLKKKQKQKQKKAPRTSAKELRNFEKFLSPNNKTRHFALLLKTSRHHVTPSRQITILSKLQFIHFSPKNIAIDYCTPIFISHRSYYTLHMT